MMLFTFVHSLAPVFHLPSLHHVFFGPLVSLTMSRNCRRYYWKWSFSRTVCAFVCREILQEIQRLRLQHEEASQPPPDKVQQNPTLLAELRLLRWPCILNGNHSWCIKKPLPCIVFCFPVRQRKDELEQRMSTLQESRRELMVQLEQLMMLLKVLLLNLRSNSRLLGGSSINPAQNKQTLLSFHIIFSFQ